MNGVLVCQGESRVKNIGDYIQSLAQRQFWNEVDCLVEREDLKNIHSQEKINLIMNAWYMWHPENFPPSEAINPLFVSVHVNPKIEKEFFTQETIEYFKKYAPIGCRDLGTQALFERQGIEAYYSSCLTLTLDKNIWGG